MNTEELSAKKDISFEFDEMRCDAGLRVDLLINNVLVIELKPFASSRLRVNQRIVDGGAQLKKGKLQGEADDDTLGFAYRFIGFIKVSIICIGN
jgi:hypothetical protein